MVTEVTVVADRQTAAATRDIEAAGLAIERAYQVAAVDRITVEGPRARVIRGRVAGERQRRVVREAVAAIDAAEMRGVQVVGRPVRNAAIAVEGNYVL